MTRGTRAGRGRRLGADVVVAGSVETRNLADALAQAGFEAVHCPVVTFGPPADPDRLAAAVARLAEYDWVVFTSRHAVRAVAEVLTSPWPAATKIAVVGPGTAQAVDAAGWAVACIPTIATGASLARSLGSAGGARILLPRSNLALADLPTILAEAGAVLDEVTAYTTQPGVLDLETRFLLRLGTVAVVFTSPSAVRFLTNAAAKAGIPVAGLPCVAIGATTAREARARNYTHVVESGSPTPEGVADAIRALAAAS